MTQSLIKLHQCDGSPIWLVAGSFGLEPGGKHGIYTGGEFLAYCAVTHNAGGFNHVTEKPEQILSMLKEAGVEVVSGPEPTERFETPKRTP